MIADGSDNGNAANRRKLAPSRLAVCCLLLYLGIIETEGLTRWLLAAIGAESLIYLRDLLPLMGIWFALRRQQNGRNIVFAVIAFQLALASIVGYYFSGNLAQLSFSLRMFVPLIFGVAIYSAVCAHWKFFGSGCLILLGIAVAGVVVNQYVQYPWIGEDFTAFNQTVELSREWTETGGQPRLPGFSRASFDAATQIVLFAVIALYSVRRTLPRLAMTAMSVYAVYLTTSKTCLACMILLIINFVVLEWIPGIRGFGRITSRIRLWGITALRWQLALATIACVVLPLQATGTLNFIERDLREDSSFHLLSFQDRAANVWPMTFEYIQRHGSSVFGVGLGGLGTPLDMFGEEDMKICGDNSFLYMYGLFGILIFLYFGVFVWMSFSKRLISASTSSVFGLLALSAAVQGITKTTIEGLYDSLFLGLVIAHLAMAAKKSTESGRSYSSDSQAAGPTAGHAAVTAA